MRIDERKATWLFWSLREIEYRLARQRHAQDPRIEVQSGHYTIRYYRREIENGKIQWRRTRAILGDVDGPGKITMTEAKQRKRDLLAEVDKPAGPVTSTMTLRQYWEAAFQAHLSIRSKSHRDSFRYGMEKHILPKLGDKQLRELTRDDVQALVTYLKDSGLSPSTIVHQRAYISTLFEHARDAKVVTGAPITKKLILPRAKKKNPTQDLTFEQVDYMLHRLAQPYLTMAALSCCTSAGIAEMSGLRRHRLNLTDTPAYVDGMLVEPWSARIVEDYVLGEYRETKNPNRERTIPIPLALVPLLQEVLAKSKYTQPDAPVFATRTGRPIGPGQANLRHFLPIAEGLRATLPGKKISWNSFRHTFASRFEDLDFKVKPFDKKCLMGHSRGTDISDRYTHEHWKRLRAIVDGLAEQYGIPALVAARREAPCPKVVSIR